MGPFPPPVHGASVSMQSFVASLESECPVVRLDVSPVGRGFGYHGSRIYRHVKALLSMVGHSRSASILYYSLPGGAGLLYSIPFLAIARILRFRIFLHHHSYRYIGRRSRLMSVAIKVAGLHTDIVLSPKMGAELSASYPHCTKLHVLSNAWAIEPNSKNDRRKKDPRPVSIGHLANLTASKGLDTVLAAFGLVQNARNVHLHIAGPCIDKQAEAALSSFLLEYPHCATYWGSVDNITKWNFYAAVDLFLFPSRYANEAEPLVIDEALAAGCQVLASRRGCVSSDAYSEPWVHLHNSDASPEDIARRVLEIIDSDDEVDGYVEHLRRKNSADQQLADLKLSMVGPIGPNSAIASRWWARR